jgi:peptidoglycan lytic transglycosylase G
MPPVSFTPMSDPTLRRADREHGPRRTALLVVLLLFLGLLGAGAWAANRYVTCREAAEGPQRRLAFTVEDGQTGQEVVDELHERGVIPCGGLVGNLLLRGTGKADRIRAGDYQLTTGMTLEDAVDVLTTPPPKVPTVELVIPEGYRLTQIAEEVQRTLKIPAKRFLRELRSDRYALPPYLPAEAISPEGFLFPKSYEFVKEGLTARKVAERLLEQFAIEAEELPFDRVEQLGVTPYELVIIASMIEEEARIEKDRRLIAGVIYNRLELGMALGIDATLLYDDPTPDGELSSSDLASNSPYNTRVHVGLPPTPIASPGAASLLAALTPADTDFLYYVLCGADGHHRFSKTNAEHIRNVDACLG